MRLLCIDHCFEQDIDALRDSMPPGSRCCSVGWERFFEIAVRFFPDEVFTGIEAYFRPEYDAERREYAAAVSKELERVYRIYRFDAVLAPSDTFFWIRAPAEWCRERGIPFVVLQKEATIPPGWMEGPAREWGRISPFIGDHMLVSSDHHRQFWVNSGVEPEQVVVTGQPRFDFYARPERKRSWDQLGVARPMRPTVLFLTYDVNAYLPVIDRTGLAPWLQLRTETEQALVELARAQQVELLVKAHPQSAEDQTEHLNALASLAGVQVLNPGGDVRQYIANADVVVGFQSTALLEALAAGRPTVYTWWTEAALAHAGELIPFHEQHDALVVARSPAELQDAVRRGLASSPAPRSEASRRLVELFLGPVDGRAGERCWSELGRLGAALPLSPAGRALRSAARASRAHTLAATATAAAAWTLVGGLVMPSYLLYRLRARLRRRDPVEAAAFRAHVESRRRRASQDLRAAALS